MRENDTYLRGLLYTFRKNALVVLAALVLLPLQPYCGHAQEVAPASSAPPALPAGITLPRTGAVYLVDTKAGASALVQLHAAEIVSNSHAAGNLARGPVYVGPRASFELKGLNAPSGTDERRPALLVHLAGDDPELLRNRVHLIRLRQTADRRVVSRFSQNVFGGQRSKVYDDVPVSKQDVDPDVWLKLTPEQPLTPGEYCVVFMPKDTNAWPDAVYDFNVAINEAKPEK